MKFHNSIIQICLFLYVVLVSCAGDDDNIHVPDSGGEEITRVSLLFQSQNGVFETSFNSLEQQDPPEIRLQANTQYNVSIEFWNDDEMPAEDVTEEIREEATEHLLCFDKTEDTQIIIEIEDTDSQGLPLGLQSIWKTGNTSFGGVEITLKHQPDSKGINGVVDCNVGETDVQVLFPIRIE